MPALDVLQNRTTARSRRTQLPPFELIGPSNAPVIVALGGISATKHVCSNGQDDSPGWWEEVAGPGRAIDTTRFRVLSLDYLDGGRATNGRPARVISTHDQAYALRRVLDSLGIARVRAIVGASYGGMVALAFAERYGAQVERLIVFGAAHEAHPMTTAIRSVQRRIVELGLDTGHSYHALALARALAMTTYRSAREFGERFDTQLTSDAEFPVEQYITHCGRTFAAAWRPERFLALSLSADLHRVDPAQIRTPTALIVAQDDQIVPISQARQLAQQMGDKCRLIAFDTRYGHDAFLADAGRFGALLDTSLTGTCND